MRFIYNDHHLSPAREVSFQHAGQLFLCFCDTGRRPGYAHLLKEVVQKFTTRQVSEK